MNQDQSFIWKSSLGGLVSWVGQSLGISKAVQTVLVSLMESQIWHQLGSAVGDKFRKGTMASAHLDAKHFSFSQYATGVLQVATPVLELRESESE